MDLDEFTAAFAGYIEVYNNTPHSGRGMNGQTPMQVMRQRTSRRAMAEGVMELLLRNWTKEITVGKNGVKVNGIGYGRYDAALLMHQGRKVRCTTSAEDIQQVSVYDAHSYQLLAIATANGQLGYGAAANADDLREATAQKTRAKRTVRQYRPAAKIAASDLTSLTIAAMRDRTRDDRRPESPAAIQPVATVMDQNVTLHRKLSNRRTVRRAAGAEGVRQVIDLQLETIKTDPVSFSLPALGLDVMGADRETRRKVDLKLYG